MSKECNLIQPKLAFVELGIQMMFPQFLQYQTQMHLMLLLILGEHQYIINENNHKFIQELHKHYIMKNVYIMKKVWSLHNNKVVIYISLYHDKCLLFMLELY